MAKKPHSRFTPIFEGRTIRATVTNMIGNVVEAQFRRKRSWKKFPPFGPTAGAMRVRSV